MKWREVALGHKQIHEKDYVATLRAEGLECGFTRALCQTLERAALNLFQFECEPLRTLGMKDQVIELESSSPRN